MLVVLMRIYKLPPSFPAAIPPGDISCREQRWYELHEQVTAFEERDRAIVQHFRRSSKIQLEGQVSLDG